MWPFRKKRYSLIDSGLLQGMTDCHSHILPGVDDGIQTEEDSLLALESLAELGIRELWLTPHIMEDIPNSPADLKQRFADLQQLVLAQSDEGSSVRISDLRLNLAAEHMLDGLFASRLDNDDLLPIFDGHCLLVETSYFNPPLRFWEMLEDIRRKGYTPLLAHPERYYYMHTPDYHHLLDIGVLFQLNILSLTGAYGETARQKSLRLLRGGCYSYVGSDLHNLDDFLGYANERCLLKDDVEALTQLLSGSDI